MAKISPKPKKTPEDEAREEQELQALLQGAKPRDGAAIATNQPTLTLSTSLAEVEQKGEKALATPPGGILAVPTEPQASAAADAQPALAVAAPEPSPAPAVESTAPPIQPKSLAAAPVREASATAPAPVIAAGEVPPVPAAVEQPIASAPTPSVQLAPAAKAETEPTNDLELEDEATSEAGSATTSEQFKLEQLFAPVPEKKERICRLSDRHYNYLFNLGVFVGNRTPPPDIVYNLIEMLINTHDKEIQKAITKQLRVARTPTKKS